MKAGIELINEIDNCELPSGRAAFWWLGQMGQAIKIMDSVIYIDAFLSDKPDRNVAPILKPEEITNADFIIGTHDHWDHIDRDVWHQLSISSPNAMFVAPSCLIDSLSTEQEIPRSRLIGLNDGIAFNKKGITISAIPSAHEFLDQDTVTGSYPYLGYIIEGDGCVLYHSGDCCIYEGLQSKLRKWKHIDAMFLPINGRDGIRYRNHVIGNMTYQEAVDLAGTIKPGMVIPGHYEMFSTNSGDPKLFIDYLEAKYPGIKYWVGEHGEMVII